VYLSGGTCPISQNLPLIKYASLMMGVYFAMTGFGNKLAGLLGEASEKLGELTIFTGIAVFCVSFGLLVMVFRNKLGEINPRR
jgi:POT family proton-dependent oligopeptide transporter